MITDQILTECDNGSYCWGEENRGCCRDGQGVFVLNGQQVTFDPNATTTSSTFSSTSTIPTTTSSSTLPPATQASLPNKGLSTGAQAGIGVGAAIGGLVILALVFWSFRRRRSNKKSQPSELGSEQVPPLLEKPRHNYGLSSPPAAKTPNSGLSELDGSTQRSGSREDFVRKELPVERYA